MKIELVKITDADGTFYTTQVDGKRVGPYKINKEEAIPDYRKIVENDGVFPAEIEVIESVNI